MIAGEEPAAPAGPGVPTPERVRLRDGTDALIRPPFREGWQADL